MTDSIVLTVTSVFTAPIIRALLHSDLPVPYEGRFWDVRDVAVVAGGMGLRVSEAIAPDCGTEGCQGAATHIVVLVDGGRASASYRCASGAEMLRWQAAEESRGVSVAVVPVGEVG